MNRSGSNTTAEAPSPVPPLVLDRQRSGNGVLCGPQGLWLRGPSGRLVPLRCGRRDCPSCQKRADDELARVLISDATVEPPTMAITLTTSDPRTSASSWREASAQMWRDLRSAYGPIRYAGFMEWTTGLSSKSGGHRRMHQHVLTKDLHGDAGEIEDRVRHHWRRMLKAPVVEVATLRSIGAAIGYVGIHHRKPEQQPPADWRGQRIRWSIEPHRYTHRPVSELRAEARESLTRERVAWRVVQDDPDTPAEMVDALVELNAAERAASEGSWELVRGTFTQGGLWMPSDRI